MTTAVGSTPPGGSEVLTQLASGKVAGGHRSHAKRPEEATSQTADEATPDDVSSDELDASQTLVDKTKKATKRDHRKSDDDSSFADTFDTIGQTQSKASSNKAEIYSANFVMAPITADGALTSKSALSATASDAQQSAIRPTARFQQKSILALLDVKDRLSTSAGQPEPQEAIQADVSTQSADHSQGETDMVPVTVDRVETHWNFTSGATSNASSQISSWQTDERKLAQDTTTALAGTAKGKTSKIDTSSTTSRQSAAAPVASPDADQQASSSFSNDDSAEQGGTDSQTQTASAALIPRKVADADSTSSLDQILATTANSQPPASATIQVRDGVLNSLESDNSNSSTNATASDFAARTTSAPVIKTLDLTLSPPDLGDVKLRLSLKSNSLSIEAEASKASTAKLLTDDRSNLERGLKDAGYDVTSMKITDTSASSSSTGSGWQANGSPSRDGDQSRSSFAGRQDSEMQRRDGSSSDQAQRRQKENNPQPATDSRNGRTGNAVYI